MRGHDHGTLSLLCTCVRVPSMHSREFSKQEEKQPGSRGNSVTSLLPKVKGIYMKSLLWLCLEGSSTCSARSLSEQSASWWVQPPEGHVPSLSTAVIFHIKVCFLAVIPSYPDCPCLASTGKLLPRALWPQSTPPTPCLASITSFLWRGQGTGHRAQGFPTLPAFCLHLHTVERELVSLDPAENKRSLLCFSLSNSLL